MKELKPKGTWRVIYSKPRSGRLVRDYVFGDFVQAMQFINEVAQIAEANGHHPNIHCYWNKVNLELYTHAVGGLSESDFVVASKINLL
jgi:4a-hydroxytetrahydrobiopterin dehydratase